LILSSSSTDRTTVFLAANALDFFSAYDLSGATALLPLEP